jgi:hypothetical protein
VTRILRGCYVGLTGDRRREARPARRVYAFRREPRSRRIGIKTKAVTRAPAATARATIGQTVHTPRDPLASRPLGPVLGVANESEVLDERGGLDDGVAEDEGSATSVENGSNPGAARLPKLMSEK